MKPHRSWIVLDNDPILKQECRDIVLPLSKDDKFYIERMVNYIDACYNDEANDINQGIAIAGPQVGLSARVIYIHFNDEEKEIKYLLANPVIVSESVSKAYIGSGEGCLSVEKKYDGIVLRKEKIVVKAFDILRNENITINASGILSICLQHEIDHLNGILYYDRIKSKISESELQDAIQY